MFFNMDRGVYHQLKMYLKHWTIYLDNISHILIIFVLLLPYAFKKIKEIAKL